MSFEYFNQKFIEMQTKIDVLEDAVGNLKQYSKKELLDRLEKFKDSIIGKLGELDDRIENLEDDDNLFLEEDGTDPISEGIKDFLNGFKERKPLAGLIAKEGTFEWALIQMKNGRVIKQKSKEARQFMKFDKFYGENPNGVLMSQWNFQEWNSSSILATDWEIVE